MPELLSLLTIGFVQLLAVMSPGPSFLITARTAVAGSRLDGFKVALGLGAGTVIWSSAALLGLNIVFRSVPVLFIAMKIAGAGFLLWIAWRIFHHAAEPVVLEAEETPGPVDHPFVKGFLTQISNPKVAVFFGSIFIAMLPADVPPWMTLALIAIVTFNEIWWYSAVALLFGSAPIRSFYLGAKIWIDRTTGLFLGVLGVRLLWAARQAA